VAVGGRGRAYVTRVLEGFGRRSRRRKTAPGETVALLLVLVVAAGLVAAVALAAAAPAHRVPVRAASAQGCSAPFPATRDPSNPLDLAHPPGADPLTGARFFVPGPAHGAAAGTIASLLGASVSDHETWAQFHDQLQNGPLATRLRANPSLGHEVAELAKIAAQPEAQRFSSYSGGGGPGAIAAQVNKIFCDSLASDPGSIPIINTYFMHADLKGCPTTAQVQADEPVFHRRIDEMAAATGRHPAVYLLELDAIGSSSCIAKIGSLSAWEADLRYEINAIAALPHTVVYVEGGYSDSNSVGYAARVLNAIGIGKIRGFFTNDTHLNWTIDEVRYATAVSKRTHGAHFIVNTADNGQGPLRNPHPRTQGVENLCNPPGRGLGPQDSTNTGYRLADAWIWTHPPGNSSGCGGGPPGGMFWPQRAVGLAERANGRLGPGFPSRPY
jgi:endoglucanase